VLDTDSFGATAAAGQIESLGNLLPHPVTRVSIAPASDASPLVQIAAVTALCRGILTRTTIPPARVLGHSDVAPSRKQDPGEKFPWRTLFDSGVGNWVKPAPISDGALLALGDRGDAVEAMQRSLAEYGYGLAINGNYNSAMHEVVAAFQRHFRPERIDGVSDASTRATLQDLLAHRNRPRTIAARVINFDLLVAS